MTACWCRAGWSPSTRSRARWWAPGGETPITCPGIWTQPAYDAVSKRLFITTGTLAEGKTTLQQPWADAFVAIEPDTMTTLDWFSPVPNDSYYVDYDFGGSPTLYDSPDGLRHYIAATNKNGWVYALDRDHLANGVVWKYQISGPGSSPDLGESSIVSSPYANGTLFVAGAKTADGLHRGAIAALDAFTGLQKWIFYPEGFVLPAMTVTGQVLFAPVSDAVTGRGKLYVLDQAGYAVEARLELDPLADEDPHRIGVEPDARLLRAHGGQVERGGRRRGKGGGQGCAVRDAAGAKAGAGP
jgi:glucose dehydrogenase